jgi:hypothetical protein
MKIVRVIIVFLSLSGVVFAGASTLLWLVATLSPASGTDVNPTKDEVITRLIQQRDSLTAINHYQDSIIGTWHKHAIRMKRIAGVPDTTVNWSYLAKLKYPVNTRKLSKR